jgi:soluble epoxide hydrolase/lipid-phosphate phosphatase
LDLNLRVLAPDMIGYGQTDAPRVPPNTLEAYSYKSTAADMAALLSQLTIPKVILLGHDWGAVVVQRIYFYYPELVSHIATISVPYAPPQRKYVHLEEVVERNPTLTYQIAFVDPETEKDLDSRDAIDRFIRGVHRGIGDHGANIQVRSGFMQNLGDRPRGKLLTAEVSLQRIVARSCAVVVLTVEKDLKYYVDQFARNGMHGPREYFALLEDGKLC